jgi:hypothetical protein
MTQKARATLSVRQYLRGLVSLRETARPLDCLPLPAPVRSGIHGKGCGTPPVRLHRDRNHAPPVIGGISRRDEIALAMPQAALLRAAEAA